MKKQHEQKTEVNLLVPVDPKVIQTTEQTDCFGKEWDARANECCVCADETLCGILFNEKVKTKKLTFEIEKGPLLDQCDFPGVDMARIERLAKKYESEGNPMTFMELQDLIQQQANTKDNETVIQFIKRKLPLTKIYLSEGLCLVRS
jgi:uncharacterized Fe-S cluster-containing radical SAM superfamily enzyme